MKKILIVDDNELNITVLLEMLGDGYDLSVALSGEEALDSVKYEVPDLIILDIVMGQLSGIDVCKKLRRKKETRGIPIIFLTATYDLLKKEAYEAGGDDFLPKPFKAKLLRQKVEDLLILQDTL